MDQKWTEWTQVVLKYSLQSLAWGFGSCIFCMLMCTPVDRLLWTWTIDLWSPPSTRPPHFGLHVYHHALVPVPRLTGNIRNTKLHLLHPRVPGICMYVYFCIYIYIHTYICENNHDCNVTFLSRSECLVWVLCFGSCLLLSLL